MHTAAVCLHKRDNAALKKAQMDCAILMRLTRFCRVGMAMSTHTGVNSCGGDELV